MRSHRFLALAAYLIGAALILVPLGDAALSISPLRVGEVRWRFGAVGMLANAFLLPNAGMLLLLATAIAYGHMWFRRTIGIVAFVGLGLTLLGITVFALDAIQLQATVPPEVRRQLWVAAGSAGVKLVLETVILLAIGLAGVAAWRTRASKNPDVAPLLVTDQGASAKR